MRRPRFHLVRTACRRCGTTIYTGSRYTGSRPLFGTPDMKARYGSICAQCVTPQELDALDREYRALFLGKESGK